MEHSREKSRINTIIAGLVEATSYRQVSVVNVTHQQQADVAQADHPLLVWQVIVY